MFFGGDPFEHFAGMGGGGGGRMPGGGGGGRAPAGPVDNDSFYKVLGLERESNPSGADIKRAYKKMALKHHPDRGGDGEIFKEVSNAFETLNDPDKKKLYDQYGKEGLEGGGGGGDADDIFSMFFGGGRGGGRGQSGPTRGEDINHAIKVTLEDLYNSKTAKLAINRDKLCEECDGIGGKKGSEKTCSDCSGRGVKVQLRQVGPGMVQQMQSVCPTCRGSCKFFVDNDKCKECRGKKVSKERKVLEVHIDRGMRNGEKIKFSGEADEAPNTIPGDVVFVLQEREHDVFKRKGADLVTTLDISLAEALCGLTRTIKTLDGRMLKIDSPPGAVIKPDCVKMVAGEGMPHLNNPYTKGRLFVHFRVTFPAKIAPAAVTALVAALPKAQKVSLTGEEEDCTMADVDMSQFGQDKGLSGVHDDEDDDDPRGGGGQQKVQCQNM